jgi:methionine-gamma-lyase
MATLPIRMREHATNAMAVAEYLENHARVEAVIYPGLRSHPQHELAASQMDNFSGMLSFRVSNSKDVAARMMSNFEIIHYAVSLGHHRSLMYLLRTDDLAETSYGLEGAELEKYRAVAGEGLFRFSVGLEDPNDTYGLEGAELEKYRAVAGEGLFRFSVGLEDPDDICAELERVL